MYIARGCSMNTVMYGTWSFYKAQMKQHGDGVYFLSNKYEKKIVWKKWEGKATTETEKHNLKLYRIWRKRKLYFSTFPHMLNKF